MEADATHVLNDLSEFNASRVAAMPVKARIAFAKAYEQSKRAVAFSRIFPWCCQPVLRGRIGETTPWGCAR